MKGVVVIDVIDINSIITIIAINTFIVIGPHQQLTSCLLIVDLISLCPSIIATYSTDGSTTVWELCMYHHYHLFQHSCFTPTLSQVFFHLFGQLPPQFGVP